MRFLIPVLALAASVQVACETDTPPAAVSDPGGNAAARPGVTVARVVFVDKENACDCTRTRTEATWTALQSALGTPARVPVERIHSDTQAAEAARYTALKPLMVIPGVYFVDDRSGVIELLQGEVTTAQVAAVLEAR
jgi:hypothetical protein